VAAEGRSAGAARTATSSSKPMAQHKTIQRDVRLSSALMAAGQT
jgi:hypothetical protein